MMTPWTFVNAVVFAQESAPAPESIPASQWWWTVAGGCLMLAALLGFVYTTRTGIIARATTKEAVRQPVFLLLLAIALVLLGVNTFLPFFSMGDDIKMLKDCGLATILICGLLLAVWTASTSISSEIEGKTAMTLLSKPINRWQFVLGKYLGIVQAVLLLTFPLVLAFSFLLFYKVGYDARESSKEIPAWWDLEKMTLNSERLEAVVQTLPGMALIVLEVSILAAVSVAISTRVPMVVNIVSCLAIFVVGHLTPVLAQVKAEGLEPVQFVANLIATVLPALEAFNISAAVATGKTVPPEYLWEATKYWFVYSAAAIVMALILFEDRDLA